MKRIISFLMVCILAVGYGISGNVQNTMCVAASKNVSVKQVYRAYNEFLEKKKYENRMTKEELEKFRDYSIGYCVLDIDQNGIPELSVSVWDKENMMHQGNIYIYTYAEKNVKYMGKMFFGDKEFHWTELFYNKKTKNIWLCDAHEGDAYYVSYTYNGKTLKKNKKYHVPYSEEDRVSFIKKADKIEKKTGKFVKPYVNTKKSRKKHLPCNVTAKTKKQKKAIRAYYNFMENKKYEKAMTRREISQAKENKEVLSSKGAGYRVLDIDQNGVPELLVVGANNSVVVNPVYIFTYQGKKVTYIGKMKLSEKEMIAFTEPRYNKKTKRLWMCSGDQDMNYVCYKYDGKSLKREKKYYVTEDGDGTKEIQKMTNMSGKDIEFHNNTARSRERHLTY